MNDRNFRDAALVGLGLLALYLLWKARSAMLAVTPSQQLPVPNATSSGGPLTPIDLAYAASPNAFGPVSIGVNVTPNLPDGLAQGYIPLFGFVGIAQGETLQ